MGSDRKARRQAAVIRNLKKQERLKRALDALPPEVKRRKIRRFGRGKAEYHLDNYIGEVLSFNGEGNEVGSSRSLIRRRRSRFRKLPAPQSYKPTKALKDVEIDNDVLFLSHVDYACVGYMFAESLKSVGVKAASLANRQINLRSDGEQSTICRGPELIEAVRRSRVVVWMHSYYQAIPEGLLRNRKRVVFHGGTRYRRSPKKMNARFNSIVNLCLIQTGELLGKGAKNERWLLPPIDLEKIQPDYSFEFDDKLVIGHFTSHPGGSGSRAVKIKGTPAIRKVIQSLKKDGFGDKFEFRSSSNARVPWNENLRRMARCDIYIESLAQGTKDNVNKHDWSVTALESCALGCITISNFLFEKRYLKEYGDHALIVANTESQLRDALIKLLSKDRDELLEMKKKARAWVEEKHSYKVVGERLKRILSL